MNIINNNGNRLSKISDLRLEHTINNMYRVVYTSCRVGSQKLVDNYLSEELDFNKALEIYLRYKEINNINSLVLISEE